jgi:hypothetical protein
MAKRKTPHKYIVCLADVDNENISPYNVDGVIIHQHWPAGKLGRPHPRAYAFWLYAVAAAYILITWYFIPSRHARIGLA